MDKKVILLGVALIIVIIFIYMGINIFSGYMNKIACVNMDGRWMDELDVCCFATCVAEIDAWDECIASSGENCVPPTEFCIGRCMVS